MNFSDVSAQVHGLYWDRRFSDALAVVADARHRFASEDATLTFWEGCLLSVSGNPSAALVALQDGVRRGLWWSGTMLGDSDLDPLRVLDGWQGLLEDGDRRAARAAAHRSEALVRSPASPEPEGVLLTLHGAGADPAEHARVWEAATPAGWMVVTPVGTVPVTVNRWSWPSTGDSTGGVFDQLPNLDWDHRVVLGGFSQGGSVAFSLLERSPHPAPQGLVLVAPAVRADALPPVPTVPTYFIIGDRDWALPGVEALAELMAFRGVAHILDKRQGLDHHVPEDFDVVLPSALDWISTTQGA